MQDLTKLTGPELANVLGELARVKALNPNLYEACVEACNRLREDDRVAMRNLERERDALRAELARERQESAAQYSIMARAHDAMREERDELRAQVIELQPRLLERSETLRSIEVILGVEDSEEEGAGYDALRKVVEERAQLRKELAEARRPHNIVER